jgi:hypothetical protein
MSTRIFNCKLSKDRFCYICANFLIKPTDLVNFSDTLLKQYRLSFGFSSIDHTKNFAPTKVCRACKYMLKISHLNRSKLKFQVPAVWREAVHPDNCYFCLTDVGRLKKNYAKFIKYPQIDSVTRPKVIPDYQFPEDFEYEQHVSDNNLIEDIQNEMAVKTSSENTSGSESDSQTEMLEELEDNIWRDDKFTTAELNDLVRNLKLSKSQAVTLGQVFKSKRMLSKDTTYSHLIKRDEDFRKFYQKDDVSIYCWDINGLFRKFQQEHNPNDWRLFIDASTKSLKAVLLCNNQIYPSIPVYYSTIQREKRDVIKDLLEKINYDNYEWRFCGDLKMIGITLGIQGTSANHPCFLCDWKRPQRGECWSHDKGQPRISWIPNVDKNIVSESLIPREKILLPPLHLKIGLMTQLMKKFVENEKILKYIQSVFPRLSFAKISNGVFNGPDIRKLVKDKNFSKVLNRNQNRAWDAFKDVIEKFFGNYKDSNHRQIVENLMCSMEALGCKMTVKVHFLDAHMDYFPENLGRFSEEQGERFHQELKDFEKRYNCYYSENILADYCWNLIRESDLIDNKKHRHFAVKYL